MGRMRTCIERERAKDYAQVAKDFVTVLAILVTGIWTVSVLREPLKSHYDLQKLKSEAGRSPGLEIKITEIDLIRYSSTEARIAAYGSIRNNALKRVKIDLNNGIPTLFIYAIGDGPEREMKDPLRIVEYGAVMSIVSTLHIEPGDTQRVSFLSGLLPIGVYSVTFEIPVSCAEWEDVQYEGSNGVWSDQKFVQFPGDRVADSTGMAANGNKSVEWSCQ